MTISIFALSLWLDRLIVGGFWTALIIVAATLAVAAGNKLSGDA